MMTMRAPNLIDHLGPAEDRFEFLDPPLDEALLFAGGMIFGVLGQVAMCAGLGDGLDDGRPVDRLQLTQLGIKRVEPCPRQGDLFHRRLQSAQGSIMRTAFAVLACPPGAQVSPDLTAFCKCAP
jgi:hypothetical protein